MDASDRWFEMVGAVSGEFAAVKRGYRVTVDIVDTVLYTVDTKR